MRLRKRIAALAVAAASIAFPLSARATLIAYDGFNYAPGSLEGSPNGGTGWLSGWYGGLNHDFVDAGGFTWPGMASTGNKGRSGGSDQAGFRVFANNKTYGGVNGGTIWISFIGKGFTPTPADEPDSYAGISLFSGANSEPFFMGMPTQHVTWGWDDDRNKTPTATNIPFAQEHLFVYRIDFGTTASAPEQVRMFVDPTPGVQPSNASAVLTSLTWAPFSFDRVRVSSGCEQNPQFQFDELRIATTYTDAAPFVGPPVPEPASLSILSLGVLLIRRHRRAASKQVEANE